MVSGCTGGRAGCFHYSGHRGGERHGCEILHELHLHTTSADGTTQTVQSRIFRKSPVTHLQAFIIDIQPMAPHRRVHFLGRRATALTSPW